MKANGEKLAVITTEQSHCTDPPLQGQPKYLASEKQMNVMNVDRRRKGRPDASTQSPDLMPSVFAHPALSTAAVWVDGNGLGGAVRVAGRAHPVVLILKKEREWEREGEGEGGSERRKMNERTKGQTEQRGKKGKGCP